MYVYPKLVIPQLCCKAFDRRVKATTYFPLLPLPVLPPLPLPLAALSNLVIGAMTTGMLVPSALMMMMLLASVLESSSCAFERRTTVLLM